jgi:serine/threonine protein kinase
MKIIKKTLIPRNNYFISFFSRVFTRIVHPNIIEYQDFYFDDINYYIIFDHSDKHNSTLKNQLDLFKNNFELKVKEVIQQVLNGLLHLHVLNIIYRNVALENILVSANNKGKINIKLMDLEKSINSESEENSSGNVYEKLEYGKYYMSPEALRKVYSEKSDVWSAGVLLYYLLYGFFPFEGDSIDEIYSKIKKGNFTLPDKNRKGTIISLQARDLVSKMLLFFPKDRPNTYQCLQHSWFDKDIIPKERNGVIALIRYTIILIIRNIFHKNDFKGVNMLFNKLKAEKGKVYINDLYSYLSEPLSRNQRAGFSVDNDLTYSDFCKYFFNF